MRPGSASNNCRVWQRCRSVRWILLHQKQHPGAFDASSSGCEPRSTTSRSVRSGVVSSMENQCLGALQERPGTGSSSSVAHEAASAASASVAGPSCGSNSSRNNAQERSVVPQAAVAGSWSVGGAFSEPPRFEGGTFANILPGRTLANRWLNINSHR